MNHCVIDPGQYADVGPIPRRLRVIDHMSRPATTIGWDEPLATAWRLMKSRRIRHLPVVDAEAVLVVPRRERSWPGEIGSEPVML